MGTFATRLKQLRKERGWSQDILAERLEISRSAVGNYETGIREPSFEMLETIADLFNVDMDFLTGRTETTTDLKDALISAYIRNETVDRIRQDERLLTYAEKLLNMNEETREFLFSQIDFLSKKGE